MILRKWLAIEKWDLCKLHVGGLAIVPLKSTKQPPETRCHKGNNNNPSDNNNSCFGFKNVHSTECRGAVIRIHTSGASLQVRWVRACLQWCLACASYRLLDLLPCSPPVETAPNKYLSLCTIQRWWANTWPLSCAQWVGEGLILGHTDVGLLFGLLAQAGVGDRRLHLSCGW